MIFCTLTFIDNIVSVYPAYLQQLNWLLSDAPMVELRLGKSLNQNSIYEGGDVYFDCLMNSRPPPLRIHWLQNVSKLKRRYM